MQLRSNIPEIIEKLEKVKAALGGNGAPPAIPDFSDAMLSALDAGMGSMKFRIFNKGMDAEGNSLGKYTGKKMKGSIFTPYEKKRVAAGRFVDKKDLQFTGGLHASIQPAKIDNSKVVIAIVNDESARIARYQEQQIGNIRAGQNAKTGSAVPAKIFTISESEYEQIKAEGNAAILQIIKRLFDQ